MEASICFWVITLPPTTAAISAMSSPESEIADSTISSVDVSFGGESLQPDRNIKPETTAEAEAMINVERRTAGTGHICIGCEERLIYALLCIVSGSTERVPRGYSND